MESFIWGGGRRGVFDFAQNPGPLGGGGRDKQGHLQPLQSPEGAQPEMRLLWFGLSLQAQVGSFFYSLYNINRISMYTWVPSRGPVPKSPVHMTWAGQPWGTQQRPSP